MGTRYEAEAWGDFLMLEYQKSSAAPSLYLVDHRCAMTLTTFGAHTDGGGRAGGHRFLVPQYEEAASPAFAVRTPTPYKSPKTQKLQQFRTK